MDIKIFGTKCLNCEIFEKKIKDALVELNIKNFKLEKVSEIEKIIKEGVMEMPALMINKKIKATGRIPSTKEIKNWINE